MKYYVTIGGRTREIEVDGARLRVDGRPIEADLTRIEGTELRRLRVGNAYHTLIANRESAAHRWAISLGSRTFDVEAVDERTRSIRAMSGVSSEEGPKPILAPMPGLVVRVSVEVGERVSAGQGLIVVEAMKMENELKATSDGVVAAIAVSPGDAVEKGTLLIALE